MSTRAQLEREADRLRYEARLAYLDGRNVRAKELNRRADLLSRQARAEASEEGASR